MLRIMRLPKSGLAPKILELLPQIIAAQPPQELLTEAQGLIARVEEDGDYLNFYTDYSGSIDPVMCIQGVPNFGPQLRQAEANFKARQALWLNCPVESNEYTAFLKVLILNPQHIMVIDKREVVILPYLDRQAYFEGLGQNKQRESLQQSQASAGRGWGLPLKLAFLVICFATVASLFASSFYQRSPYYGWMQRVVEDLERSITRWSIDPEVDLKEIKTLQKIVDLRLALAQKMRDHNLIQTGAYLARVPQDAWDSLRRLRLERQMAALQGAYAESQKNLEQLKAELAQAKAESTRALAAAEQAEHEAEALKHAAFLAEKAANEARLKAAQAGAEAELKAAAERAARLEIESARAAAAASAEAAQKAEAARLAVEKTMAAERAAYAQAQAQKPATEQKRLPKCSVIRQQGTIPYLLLASDGSGSMVTRMPDGNDRIDAAIDAASLLIDRLDKHVPIHFFGIQGCPAVADYGVFSGIQRKALKHVLHKTDPRGDPLYEFIMTPLVSALEAFGREAPAMADSVGIIVTDGHDTCAPRRTDICRVAQRVHMQKPRLKINIVFIGSPSELQPMRCVAQVTGGQVYSSRDTAGLVRSLTEAAEHLQKVCEE